MQKGNRWFEFKRKPAIDQKEESFKKKLGRLFYSSDGKEVLNHWLETIVMKPFPHNKSDSAWRETEGKKIIVLEIKKALEDYELGLKQRNNTE